MKKILIVDDEFIVRMGVKSILDWEEHGYTISGDAENGEAALRLIEVSRPDIVLTDLMMEGMDGFELIRQCRKRFPQIKFVVLSSYNDFDNVKRAMKLGASDYIFKMTMRPEELLSILDEVSATIGMGNEEVDALVRRNKQAIKKNVFSKCITQTYFNLEEVESELKILHLDIDFSTTFVLLYYVVCSTEMDDRLLLEKDDKVSLLQFSMENIADEVLKNVWRSESFPVNRDMVVSVIHLKLDTSLEEELKLLENKFLMIQEYFRRYLNLTVYGVLSDIGTCCAQLEELHHNCMKARFHYRGEEKLIRCSQNQRSEIVRAKEYILCHLQEPLTVAKVARVACMSESYFSSVFKRETGISFTDYVNQVRIQKAAELLKQGDFKIYRICQQVGIENPNYFSILFKKIMGVSPNAYRAYLQKI